MSQDKVLMTGADGMAPEVQGCASGVSGSINPLAVLVEIALHQIGQHEIGDSNSGPRIVEYQRATNEPGTGWPWCAAFVCWVVAALARLRPGVLSCENELPREASVVGLLEWARKGQLVFERGSKLHAPQAGDIACFHFSTGNHCGIVTGFRRPARDTLEWMVPTIEGNTAGPAAPRAAERNGGQVAAKVRTEVNVSHYIRLSLKAQHEGTKDTKGEKA